LPVIFCLDRSGLVGQDGATHHGVFDIAYLRCIPNLIIFAPRNEIELRHIMFTAQLGLNAPIAIRYPRGTGVCVNWKVPFEKIEIGTGVQLKKGHQIAVLSFGTIAKNVTEAIRILDNLDSISHYDLRFVKPLDYALLHKILGAYSHIITVEDGVINGGFGSAILEFAAQHDYSNKIHLLGIPDAFIEHGTTEDLFLHCNLDAISISEFIKELL
jgi:1-deoxy-D-xylulose-5-phosphate synthase